MPARPAAEQQHAPHSPRAAGPCDRPRCWRCLLRSRSCSCGSARASRRAPASYPASAWPCGSSSRCGSACRARRPPRLQRQGSSSAAISMRSMQRRYCCKNLWCSSNQQCACAMLLLSPHTAATMAASGAFQHQRLHRRSVRHAPASSRSGTSSSSLLTSSSTSSSTSSCTMCKAGQGWLPARVLARG